MSGEQRRRERGVVIWTVLLHDRVDFNDFTVLERLTGWVFGRVYRNAAAIRVADIVGRRLGKDGKKWPKPFDERKSFAGSVAMVIAGFIFTLSLTHLFGVMGYFPNNHTFGGPDDFGYHVSSSLCAFSPSSALPASTVDDNISVATVAIVLGSLAFCDANIEYCILF